MVRFNRCREYVAGYGFGNGVSKLAVSGSRQDRQEQQRQQHHNSPARRLNNKETRVGGSKVKYHKPKTLDARDPPIDFILCEPNMYWRNSR